MKKIKLSIVFVTAAFLVGLSGQSYAEKVAYVDARKLIEQAPQGVLESKKLEEAFSGRNSELRGKVELFLAQKAEFEKNSVLMSADEAGAKAKELRGLQRELEREQRLYNEDFAVVKNEGLARLESLISQVIVQIAEEEGIDLVLQQVVYASDKINLTERVLKELEKQVK